MILLKTHFNKMKCKGLCMKKKIVILLGIIMTMSLIACGKTEPVMENDSTDTTVNVTDDTYDTL